MSPKPKKEVSRRFSKTLKKVVKVNLLNVLNENITKPIVNFMNRDLINSRKNKIKAEFHYSPNYKENHNENKENLLPRNVRCIEFSSNESSPSKLSLRQQLKEFARKHKPTSELFEDVLKIMHDNGLNVPRCTENIFHKKFEVLKMSCGQYLNFGIEKSIKQVIFEKVLQNNYQFYFHVEFYSTTNRISSASHLLKFQQTRQQEMRLCSSTLQFTFKNPSKAMA